MKQGRTGNELYYLAMYTKLLFQECSFLCVSIMTVLFVYSMEGVPLTTSNVLAVVRKVKNWWIGWLSVSLTDWLYIPESKQKEIKANFPDELDQKKEAISYWINTDPRASWRRLIIALDGMEETKLANSIKSNAEPLTGMYVYQLLTLYCEYANKLVNSAG